MKYAVFSLVRTRRRLPDYGLQEGAFGTVLEIYDDGAGYDVEFPGASNLSHVVSVRPEDIKPASQPERARVLADTVC